MTLSDRAIQAGEHIFTWTSEPEMAWLAEQVSQVRIVVEVGSYMGRTAKLFAVACPGTVYCVDHFETAGVQKVFEYFLRDEITSGKVKLLPLNSKDGAERLKHLRGQIDMVFIDDGHAHENVVDDITAWLPLMRAGGLVCGHDYYINDGKPNDVAGAVIQMLPRATIQVGSIWATRA